MELVQRCYQDSGFPTYQSKGKLMERAIVHSDLTKKEIQPQLLLEKYHSYLDQDIKRLLPAESLKEVTCPITSEETVRDNFKKWR